MKKSISTLFFSLFAVALMAQVPPGFSCQAVVRNNSGEVADNSVTFAKISNFSIQKCIQIFLGIQIEFFTESRSANVGAGWLDIKNVGNFFGVESDFQISTPP